LNFEKGERGEEERQIIWENINEMLNPNDIRVGVIGQIYK
jgi:hypothetical protein